VGHRIECRAQLLQQWFDLLFLHRPAHDVVPVKSRGLPRLFQLVGGHFQLSRTVGQATVFHNWAFEFVDSERSRPDSGDVTDPAIVPPRIFAIPLSEFMHAVDFLKQSPAEIPPVVVLTGGQRHLKQAALGVLRQLIIADDDSSLTRFQGRDAELQGVADELHTVSMWGDRRLVVVDDADDFVTKYRAGLEKLIEKPARKSVLVLDVKSLPKTTRLYKQVVAKGLEVDCSELKGPQLFKWLQETARDQYGKTLTRDGAALLIELIGEELGMLNSELAKLASYAADKSKIDVDDVTGLVGGWRTETTWVLLDAVRDDDLSFALGALDQLLTAGEHPVKLLGGISFVFKKFAQAVELARTTPLEQSLRQAGTFPGAVAAGQAYLRRLGRGKAERILQRLLIADAGLKGANPLPERLQLERLLLELAGRL
jgi:DNA polymerase-3 subunit delta